MLGRRFARCLLAALGCGLSWASAASAAIPVDGTGAAGAKWSNPIVRVAVDHSAIDMDPLALDSIIQAISAWQVAAPNLPTIVVEQSTDSCQAGYNSNGGNRNCVLFAKDGAAIAKGALAITVITFDQASGQILDADIVINGEHHFGEAEEMSTKQSSFTYDLQNVLTHEFGHFLGLGEEYKKQQATMFAYSLPGETEKRDLDVSDQAAIGTLYDKPQAAETPSAGCTASVSRTHSSKERLASTSCAVLAALFALQRRRRSAVAGALLALGLCFSVNPGVDAAPESRVAALSSHWEAGVIVTTASLQPTGCADCAPQSVSVYGGTVDGISQQVGLLRPLQVGDHVVLGNTLNALPASDTLTIHGVQQLQSLREE